MNENTRIEEMARVMCGNREKSCLLCPIQSPCLMRNCAELLNAEGYCKASEGAREIFAEIQAEIKAALDSNYKALPKVELSEELWSCVRGKIDCLRGLDDFIDELKKKYTEVDENENS